MSTTFENGYITFDIGFKVSSIQIISINGLTCIDARASLINFNNNIAI